MRTLAPSFHSAVEDTFKNCKYGLHFTNFFTSFAPFVANRFRWLISVEDRLRDTIVWLLSIDLMIHSHPMWDRPLEARSKWIRLFLCLITWDRISAPSSPSLFLPKHNRFIFDFEVISFTKVSAVDVDSPKLTILSFPLWLDFMMYRLNRSYCSTFTGNCKSAHLASNSSTSSFSSIVGCLLPILISTFSGGAWSSWNLQALSLEGPTD